MSKNCYLIFDEEGVLTCTVNHRDPKNCDLYEVEPPNTKHELSTETRS